MSELAFALRAGQNDANIVSLFFIFIHIPDEVDETDWFLANRHSPTSVESHLRSITTMKGLCTTLCIRQISHSANRNFAQKPSYPNANSFTFSLPSSHDFIPSRAGDRSRNLPISPPGRASTIPVLRVPSNNWHPYVASTLAHSITCWHTCAQYPSRAFPTPALVCVRAHVHEVQIASRKLLQRLV